ncbi:MAG: hypothetical protein ACOCUN_01585 [Jiangellaceae bacterium]
MKTNTLVVDPGGWVSCPRRGHTNVEVCLGCSFFEDLRDLPSKAGARLGYKELRCSYRRSKLRVAAR